MGLPEIWFILVAVFFLGFFILEGFDFGVGMLMAPLGRMGGRGAGPEAADDHRRAVLNTIGPVWDGNEVWIITAAAAMFAAFPGWYATLFSGLYIPLLLILFTMILRVVAIEWRGKIDDPKWRHWADIGIAAGSWVPAILWGTTFSIILRGLPIGPDQQVVGLSFSDVINPYTVLGGLATCGVFLLHGVAYLALKSAGEVRDNALTVGRWLLVPVVVIAGAFGLWTLNDHGKPEAWVAFGIAVLALLGAAALLRVGTRDGWAFTLTTIVVAGVVSMLFIALYPNVLSSTLNPEWDLTIYNASSAPYTLTIMTWAAAVFAPVIIAYQAWTYWVFRQRISADRMPASIGLPGRES